MGTSDFRQRCILPFHHRPYVSGMNRPSMIRKYSPRLSCTYYPTPMHNLVYNYLPHTPHAVVDPHQRN